MPSKPKRPLELIFLGTGTSSSLPHVECLTARPNDKKCRVCLSTLKPEGKHNIRRNTGAVIRTEGKDGKMKTIVIDVGKNFQASALEWFPKHGLRVIDAVLITHPHADAMFGLDDLRVWTLRGAIQPHIDLYCSRNTYVEVQRSFPYLVSREFASGGGDVPEFKWHVIEDGVPFELADTGIEVTPFSVHHGRYFSMLPPPGCAPTPGAGTPAMKPDELPLLTDSLSLDPKKSAPEETIHPYLCFGFKIQDTVLYMSDVSHIPDEAWAVIEGQRTEEQIDPSSTPTPSKKISVLVVDCLRLISHTSHFGIAEAVTAARRVGALRTYWTGFAHDIGHDEYVTIGEALDGRPRDAPPLKELTAMESKGFKVVPEGSPLWVRPAHDGLRITVQKSAGGVEVRDDTYDTSSC